MDGGGSDGGGEETAGVLLESAAGDGEPSGGAAAARARRSMPWHSSWHPVSVLALAHEPSEASSPPAPTPAASSSCSPAAAATDARNKPAVAALSGSDDECLRILAKILEEQRMGWMQHIYSDDLDTDMDRLHERGREDAQGPDPDVCSVM